MSIKKIYIALFIIALILIIYTSALFIGCSPLNTGTETDRQAVEDGEEGESNDYDSGRLRERDYIVAFLEIGIDEDSMHFEHRVAGIYAISPDGSGRKLIFTDLNEKYDLGKVYGISPDGSMISCVFLKAEEVLTIH